ncbi:unnamed protein product [Blepharisma stoltei]|uniref:Uncharacterized protein n=1 Tax=Blepharisma stoltei TaxID=1481888 RepID=A0AAU9JTC1_9CILI|nr:unnamed protein product [Blepharisma stoltei]
MSKPIRHLEKPHSHLSVHNSPSQANSSFSSPQRSNSKPPSSSFHIPSYLGVPKKNRYKSPESSANHSYNGSPSPNKKYEFNEEMINSATKALLDIKDEPQQKDNNPQLQDYLKQIRSKMDYYRMKSKNLEKENSKLKEDILKYPSTESSTISGSSERWEKEKYHPSEELKKIEKEMRAQEENLKLKLGNEIVSLKKIISEKDQKIQQLELELQKLKVIPNSHEIYQIAKKFQEENQKLKEDAKEINSKILGRLEYEQLEKQFQELEDMQNRLIMENDNLKQELKILNSDSNHLGMIYFANDVQKIKKDLGQVLVVLETLKEGKQVSLKVILGLEEREASKQSTVQQINQDISNIKSSLNQIRTIIADFHAEQCGNHSCATQ